MFKPSRYNVTTLLLSLVVTVVVMIVVFANMPTQEQPNETTPASAIAQSTSTIYPIYSPIVITNRSQKISSPVPNLSNTIVSDLANTQILDAPVVNENTPTAVVISVESSPTPDKSTLLFPSTETTSGLGSLPDVLTSTGVVSHTRPSPTATPSYSPTPLSVTVTASNTAVGMSVILPKTPTPTRTSTPTVTATPTISWPQINTTTFKSGFSRPVFIANANDGTNRIFIVEQCGTVRIIDSGGSTLSTPFLSISGLLTCSGNEQGLLSIAFPPDYGTKQYFYAAYTISNGSLRVSRFNVPTANQANSSSPTIIITIPHTDNTNHNGGQLAFGNDGYLYISIGDGGGGGDTPNNAQNKDILLGKLLRIDVESGAPTYAIPPTNPFVGVSGADEIWAFGLRNPWRFSFDRQTHDLYIGDVGQDLWEEVDFQSAAGTGGKNYGWRLREGNHCYNPSSGCGTPANYSAPVAEYSHSLGCSISGGYVYRGSEHANMVGFYFYGDYCSGRIWGLKKQGSTWRNQLLLESSHNISSFGEDEAGNLYLADLGDGTIYKIDSSP